MTTGKWYTARRFSHGLSRPVNDAAHAARRPPDGPSERPPSGLRDLLRDALRAAPAALDWRRTGGG
ncbi:hypothetical protein TPA0910_36090 [Streptomyces hygroscopicus subsp. sporocinereus]|uniref:Uncharacterized protein n=1 Tax=Streptomyces hygroscopicus TaxID=1912 RepID=A0ABQ3U1D4_STRHY|nr:hypothetical protein TPA0910_36090 [Streptomyces hygroscopicus]